LLTAGVLLLLGIVVGVVVFTFNNDADVARQTRLYQANSRLIALFSTVQDAETGQRGYLITRDHVYLRPYQAALADIPRRLNALEEVVSDDPDQQADYQSLKRLIPEKIAELQKTVDLAESGKSTDAVDLVASDRGRALMEQIRVTVGRMRERQAGWIQDVNADVQRAGMQLRFGVGAVALGVALLGTYAFSIKRRQRLALERHAQLIEGHSRALEETNRQLIAEVQTRKAAEDQIRQMQKMEAIGQLTGGLAHDFNNMLAVVVSALGLTTRRLAAGDFEVGKYIEAASEAAHRAATLTRRLLAFSRQQPLAPESIDANKMVSDMSELLRRTLGESISLETVLAGGLWRVNADASQLENSVVNLAVNARDAMPEGGRITIETANAHLDDLYTAQNPGAKPGQYVMVAVTDTGTGMSPEVMAKAFDPFFTTKGVGKGTGLGLSQVYGFVKQSDGHIKIYSELGQGTTVKLYLPRHFATGTVAPGKAVQGQVEAPTGNEMEVILLVEDEERVRHLTADTLREIGYSVILAESGRTALRKLEEHPEISLLFTDIVMPEMSGRALADAAAKIRPRLKVLYTTGFTRNAVVHNGILDPGVNFIAKPFTLEQIAAKIRGVLDA
jgi:signal transduction histidine kinase/CheY-like chemotaxis protein